MKPPISGMKRNPPFSLPSGLFYIFIYMKKILFIIWGLTTFINSLSQPKHKPFGTTYIYSEADGIDEPNYHVAGMAADGRIFFHAHNGSLYIVGNNYTKKIKFPLNVTPLHCTIWEIDSVSFIISWESFYGLIKNDSLVKIVKAPVNGSFTVFRFKNKIAAYAGNKLYEWVKDTFLLKYSAPHINQCQTYFFTDSVDNIWQLSITGKEAKFYKIEDLSNAKYQFTEQLPNDFTCVQVLKITSPISLNLFPFGNGGVSTGITVPVAPVKDRFYISHRANHYSVITDRQKEEKFLVETPAVIMGMNLWDSVTQTFFFGTYDKPLRYFPYLKKYRNIYSSSVSRIVQDEKARIWIGSYDGGLTILSNDSAMTYWDQELKFMPAGFSTKNHVYLASEKTGDRFVQFDMNRNKRTLLHNKINIYSSYLDSEKQQAYLGTGALSGLFITDVASLESRNPSWKIIDSSKGMPFRSIASITKDNKGRIWMGNPNRGISIYYPWKNMAKTWLVEHSEIEFGFWSAIVDNKGTVWMGTEKKGLRYYNDYHVDTVLTQKIKKVKHPLLPDEISIQQLAPWGNWLIIGTGKDILLLDLEKWYKTKTAFVRYINPQEAELKPMPEQNTILVDRRDSSVWFATSDMLYQWDIKQWLSLPVYKVNPNVIVHLGYAKKNLNTNNIFKVDATNNTLNFSIWFQSRDNMPRYMSVALIGERDTLRLPLPSLKTNFTYQNLASGKYELIIQICQSDGSVSLYKYQILIKKFWWQYWWVWIIFSLAIIIPVILWMISRNKARIAEEKARRREAELEAIKITRQKEFAALQITSLSNQFRPHFILNALNTIGAELDNKPQAESVLSRLGESVDIIFSHAKQQKIAHSFLDEWKLVTNIIDIHKTMYLKTLEVTLPVREQLDDIAGLQIPLGILQIPVENALLHGLSNRENGPWKLTIEIIEKPREILVQIVDNGVGRKKASFLSNYQKHGTGIKNLNSILQILNRGKAEKIFIQYEDVLHNQEYTGTKVTIVMPKKFQYEI